MFCLLIWLACKGKHLFSVCMVSSLGMWQSTKAFLKTCLDVLDATKCFECKFGAEINRSEVVCDSLLWIDRAVPGVTYFGQTAQMCGKGWQWSIQARWSDDLLLSEAFATATVNVRAATQSQGTNLCAPWKYVCSWVVEKAKWHDAAYDETDWNSIW